MGGCKGTSLIVRAPNDMQRWLKGSGHQRARGWHVGQDRTAALPRLPKGHLLPQTAPMVSAAERCGQAAPAGLYAKAVGGDPKKNRTAQGEMSLIIAGSKKSWNTQVGLNSSPGKLMETYFTSCNSALDYCRLKAVDTILFLLEIVLILYFGRGKSASAPH